MKAATLGDVRSNDHHHGSSYYNDCTWIVSSKSSPLLSFLATPLLFFSLFSRIVVVGIL